MRTSLHSGGVIDHYRLDWLVARSGTAWVFRATDLETGAPVAIKVPHSRRRHRFSDVFAAERKITESLNHPGVARILPNGGGSRPYVVMEWVDGAPLRDLMEDRDSLSIERSLQIAIKICDVLAYVHERGFAHLDLKPDNIFLDNHDRVKLIDFDLAREVRRRLSRFWFRKGGGTPDYASPEQIRGRAGDFRSDVYSLGLILYEMLTGDVPFADVGPAMALKLRDRTDPPAPAEINPDVPPDLDKLVLRAIARDPANRPATARTLYEELLAVAQSCVSELAPAL